MSVLIETSRGDLVVDLFCDDAPVAARNFLRLCRCVCGRSRQAKRENRRKPILMDEKGRTRSRRRRFFLSLSLIKHSNLDLLKKKSPHTPQAQVLQQHALPPDRSRARRSGRGPDGNRQGRELR